MHTLPLALRGRENFNFFKMYYWLYVRKSYSCTQPFYLFSVLLQTNHHEKDIFIFKPGCAGNSLLWR